MEECSTSTLSLHGALALQIVSGVTSNMLRAAKNPPPTLSPEAKKRLKWIEYREAHEHKVSLTCRHFDISRPTLRRWLSR